MKPVPRWCLIAALLLVAATETPRRAEFFGLRPTYGSNEEIALEYALAAAHPLKISTGIEKLGDDGSIEVEFTFGETSVVEPGVHVTRPWTDRKHVLRARGLGTYRFVLRIREPDDPRSNEPL